jgi:hypothetical protein
MGIELSMNYVAWRFSEFSIHLNHQTSLHETFGCSEISKENWRTAICKIRMKFSRHFKNCEIALLLRSFKWHLNHGATGCAGSLNMTESTFVNDIFTIRLFHGQVKIGIRSHYFSAALYSQLEQDWELSSRCSSTGPNKAQIEKTHIIYLAYQLTSKEESLNHRSEICDSTLNDRPIRRLLKASIAVFLNNKSICAIIDPKPIKSNQIKSNQIHFNFVIIIGISKSFKL